MLLAGCWVEGSSVFRLLWMAAVGQCQCYSQRLGTRHLSLRSTLLLCLLTTRFNNLISCAVAATFLISSWSLSRLQIANLQLLRGGPNYLCFCTMHSCWARYCCLWKTCVALNRDSCQHRAPTCVYVHVSLVIVLPDTWKNLRVLFVILDACFQACLRVPQSVGMIGGRPRNALWFYGCQNGDGKLLWCDGCVCNCYVTPLYVTQSVHARLGGSVRLRGNTH